MTIGAGSSRVLTLVFTDIEGSTHLLRELGEESYVQVLAEHRRLLREAFRARGGVEVDTQGDALFYVFPRPSEALRAVAEGKAPLDAGPVKVRIGVHTGDVVATDEGYAGHEVHRAARIAAAGHGGQILVSEATRALLAEDGPTLVGLGEHRLKDFDEPMALYQLGSEPFPPLRTISNTNLPRPASTFVGREQERDEVVGLVREGHRLVTLTGPGGTGKTRLALEAAAELIPSFAGGVFWVPLAALRDPALVLEAAARTLGSDDLRQTIGDRELLLVLDNLEQVIDAAMGLADLVAQCPHLHLVVTSRELLRVPGELEYAVPPLSAPDAVELFCMRAHLNEDENIRELCRRLDQLPLALELAAARTSVLTPRQILDRLGQHLDLLKAGRGADERQRTLRATIEWSHDLLDEDEQQLFAWLGVFRGGCTLEAAEAVAHADLDVLQSLVDKSLVRHIGERFSMLETIRRYAWEQLEALGDLDELRRRHAHHLVESLERALESMESHTSDSSEVLTALDADNDNVRSALEWARAEGEDEVLLSLVAGAETYWKHRGYEQDADVWYPLAVERGTTPVSARMRVLRAASTRAAERGEYARSDALVAEWRAVAELAGDEFEVIRAMNSAALNATEQGRSDEAKVQLMAVKERAEAGGFDGLVAFATINLGTVANETRDFPAALEYATAAVAMFRGLRDDFGTALALDNAAAAALELGRPADAVRDFCEAVGMLARLRARQELYGALVGMACALSLVLEHEDAARLLSGAAVLRKELEFGLDELQQEQSERALVRIRAALGDQAFGDAWRSGESLSWDELVELARAAERRTSGAPH
jgi:predicted ATPase/class 3 adenylate cyclase